MKRDMRRSGRMKDGEREQPIENYGKKEQKERLDNTLPDPHPCTAGNKEEELTEPLYSREQGGRAHRTPVQQGTRRKSSQNPCTAGNKEEELTEPLYSREQGGRTQEHIIKGILY